MGGAIEKVFGGFQHAVGEVTSHPLEAAALAAGAYFGAPLVESAFGGTAAAGAAGAGAAGAAGAGGAAAAATGAGSGISDAGLASILGASGSDPFAAAAADSSIGATAAADTAAGLGATEGGISAGSAAAGLGAAGVAGAAGAAGASGAAPSSQTPSFLSDVTGAAKSVFGSPITKGIESAAPYVLAASSASQSASLQKQALALQQQQISAQQPALNAANQALQEYSSGTLSGPQQAAITQWTDQATAQVKNSYAQMGLSGSSQEASAIAQVQQQAQAQGQTYIQQNFANAMQALGLSNGVYSGITQSQLSTSAGMQSALGSLAQALGVAASKPATTTAPAATTTPAS